MPTSPQTPLASPSAKIRFVVLDENIFGYIDPRLPLTLFILQGLPSKGASLSWQDGSCALPLDPAWVSSAECPKPLDLAAVNAGRQAVRLDPAHVRPATLADCEPFRIRMEDYAKYPDRYEIPAA